MKVERPSGSCVHLRNGFVYPLLGSAGDVYAGIAHGKLFRRFKADAGVS